MKKLSIIIPVLNEETTLVQILKQVYQAPSLDFEKEIIVVDDGSTDRSGVILENLKDKYQLIVLRHQQNLGKGEAVQTGLAAATGEAIIIQDADLEYQPEDWPKLLKKLESGQPEIGAVYGSRNINPERRGYFRYVLGVWFLTLINNLLFGAKLTDVYTCYKLFPANLIKSIPLESDGFEIEAEITAKILKKGYQIKEVPISYYPRKFQQGKKIRFRDGLKGLKTMIKWRFRKN
ncbi:MAG: glycosyltransferase family 2 protein [Patescibacteria group bacterium]